MKWEHRARLLVLPCLCLSFHICKITGMMVVAVPQA